MTTVTNPILNRRTLFGLGAGIAAAPTLTACSGASTTAGGAGDTIFLSTQFAPVEESQRFQEILGNFIQDPKTSFQSMPTAEFSTQLRTQVDSKKLKIGVVGALHGDFTPLADYLEDIDDLVDMAKEAGISEDLLVLGKLGGSKQKYIPWMQASYVVCVKKEALQWLPEDADVNALTYDNYLQWAINARKAKGQPVFGFPAGPKGLYHRFFQGFLLPSFTGGVISQFTSDDHVEGWKWMKEFWANCNPASTNYDYLQEPLARGEVQVGWDHVARLVQAPANNPDEWTMVPSPIGPKGLGYMLIVAGIGIPKGGDQDAAKKIIEGLSKSDAQIELLRQNAFFPVVKADLPKDLPAPISLEADAIKKQAENPEAILALPPLGLGEHDGEFSQIFKDMFREICLENGNPRTVINKYASNVDKMLTDSKVPCWSPDPEADVCKVG